MAPLVSVITLCWNKKHLIEGFLYSFDKNTSKETKNITELIIVDNGSNDGTQKVIDNWFDKSKFPAQKKVIRFQENMGFSKGNNAAILQHKGEFVFLMNNDVVFTGDPIEYCLAAFKKLDRRDVMLGSRLLTHDTGWNCLKGKPVPYIEGWSKFFHEDVLLCVGVHDTHGNFIGIFDEQFSPAFYEDVDLGLRCKLAGVEMIGMGEIPLRHLGSQTSFKTPGFYPIEVTQENKKKFLAKWDHLTGSEF